MFTPDQELFLFKVIMPSTNATDLAQKMLRGRHFMGLNSLNFILCSWCHLVLHRSFDPVWTLLTRGRNDSIYCNHRSVAVARRAEK